MNEFTLDDLKNLELAARNRAELSEKYQLGPLSVAKWRALQEKILKKISEDPNSVPAFQNQEE